MRILQYNTKGASQICLLDLIYIDSVISDLTILNIIEPVDQIRNCCFTCTCRSYESNFLSGFCEHLDIVKYDLLIAVTKVHIIKFHFTFQFTIAGSICVLMIMLPCPKSRSLRAFLQLAVFILHGVDKLDIALIRLRRHVRFLFR